MSISWRPAVRLDIDLFRSAWPKVCAQDCTNTDDLVRFLDQILDYAYFFSSVIESDIAIQGQHLVGIGLALIVQREFAEAEVSYPRPRMLSRILEGMSLETPTLATRSDIARENSVDGVDVLIPFCGWRDEVLSPEQTQEVKTLLVTGLASVLDGFRINRILAETESRSVADFYRRSVEYKVIAEFPESGRTLYLMTMESATTSPGSIGNVIFRRRRPLLCLRASHQELLIAALSGATDSQLSVELGLTITAVKARWRSIFERVAVSLPSLIKGSDWTGKRGMQKRHRVLSYVREHAEELRPYRTETDT